MSHRASSPVPCRPPYDDLVVGAGFAGAVLAERLAAGLGRRVLVIDKRDHIGGNAYDAVDAAGVLVHRYGPHVFHTNAQPIVDYLSRFTRWRPYVHRVLASVDGRYVPFPINRTTLNSLYGESLGCDAEAEAFLARRAEPREPILSAEDAVVSRVGRDLFDRFFRGYTQKQWGLGAAELPPSLAARVESRLTLDDRYFTDRFQAMPADGYTRLFEAMLDHPNITVATGVDFADVREEKLYDRLVFTGRIDSYFDYRLGVLPYRSLTFRHETLDQPRFQPAAVVNYPDEAVPYTRITEHKYLTGQTHRQTTITYEFPGAGGEPYYPVPTVAAQSLFARYQVLARTVPGVCFVGRLATYRYYNMDQVVAQALAAFARIAGRRAADAPPAAMKPMSCVRP